MVRGISNPEFSAPDFTKVKELKEKGLSSIFQKKKKTSGYTNLTVYDEEAQEQQQRESPIESPTKSVPKPLFKPRKSFGSSSGMSRPKRLGDNVGESHSPRSASPKEQQPPQEKLSPLPKPKETTAVPGNKKRAPPPRPQPFAKTHPTQAAKLNALIKAQKSVDEESDDPVNGEHNNHEADLSAKAKASNSMEDLLKNLQDFEEAEAGDLSPSVHNSQKTSVEYETYERPQTPPREVETIKISEYKSDSESEENEEELDGIGENEDDEVKAELPGKPSTLTVTHGEDWNPHEWIPSPEPQRKAFRKGPSWSFDVNSGQDKETESTSQPKSSSPKSLSPARDEKTKPVPPPKVMSRPRRSSGSPTKTPTASPRATPSASPKLPVKTDHPPVPAQKPVAPPRQRRKVNNGSINKDSGGKRAPSRAPPPPPPYKKPSAIPTSQSETNMQGSKIASSTSNSSPLQRR